MYCPRCGQQQLSAQTKYCSRCGFQLGIVAELLNNNGFLPQLAELYGKRTFFTRRNGLIFSLLWFIFFLFIMTPFWGIMNVDDLAGLSAILAIFGGLLWVLVSFLLLRNPPKEQFLNLVASPPDFASSPASLHGHHHQQALPPQQTHPVSSYAPPAAGAWRAPETGEFANRPESVTESTTKLLRDEERR